MHEMVEVARCAGPMTDQAVRRFEVGRHHLVRHRAPRDLAEVKRRLAELLPEWG
jgi:hypothetical protein